MGNPEYSKKYFQRKRKERNDKAKSFKIKSLKGEIWRSIPRLQGRYEFSNLGRVKSLYKYGFPEKILYGNVDSDGYIKVSIYDREGKRITGKVHRLVAYAFIENPEQKPQINHLNGFKWDNRVSNLEWATNSENQIHAKKIGLNKNFGEGSNFCKIKTKDAIFIFNSSLSSMELSGMFSITQAAIRLIKRGINWRQATEGL